MSLPVSLLRKRTDESACIVSTTHRYDCRFAASLIPQMSDSRHLRLDDSLAIASEDVLCLSLDWSHGASTAAGARLSLQTRPIQHLSSHSLTATSPSVEGLI